MIEILLLLTVCFFAWALVLIVPFFGSFVLISLAAAVYIVFFGFIVKKPAYSLYGFVILSLFFPRRGNDFGIVMVEETLHVSLASLLQCVAAVTICIRILRRKQRFVSFCPKKLRICSFLIGAVVVLAFLVALTRELVGGYTEVANAPGQVIWLAPLLFGVVFLNGCIFLITGTKEVERIFQLLALFGMVLVAEVILYSILEVPLPYLDRAISSSGRFRSFFLADYNLVTLTAIAALSCTLYFVATRARSYVYLMCVPLLFLPMLYTAQRTPMVAGIASIVVFLTYAFKMKPSTLIPLIALVALVPVVWWMYSYFSIAPVEELTSFVRGEIRVDYFSSALRSWRSRWGSFLRATDVIFYSAPFGVGARKMTSFMQLGSVPNYLGLEGFWAESETFYYVISKGVRPTGPHNAYLNFIGEFGLLAVVSLYMFLSSVARNMIWFAKSSRRGYRGWEYLYLSQLTAYASLVGLGIYAMFQDEMMYWLISFFFFLTFFLGGSMAGVSPQPRLPIRIHREPEKSRAKAT